MPSQQEILDAIAERISYQISQSATSDTILKLAEAWAWVHSPDQPHGASPTT